MGGERTEATAVTSGGGKAEMTAGEPGLTDNCLGVDASGVMSRARSLAMENIYRSSTLTRSSAQTVLNGFRRRVTAPGPTWGVLQFAEGIMARATRSSASFHALASLPHVPIVELGRIVYLLRRTPS